MNHVYFYFIFFSTFSGMFCAQICGNEQARIDEQMQLDAEKIADLFGNEDDFFAQEAATTSVMQK